MKRSKAPSSLAKFRPPVLTNDNNKRDVNGSDTKKSPCNIIQEVLPKIEESRGKLQQGNDGQEHSLRIFNVVYGKISKKKHKTWEGDGMLEVGLSTTTLKDTSGKILGQVRSSKNLNIEEGTRIFVGNKEVEIIDAQIQPVAQVKRVLDECGESDQENNPKKHKSSSNLAYNSPEVSVSFIKSKLHSKYEPLVMPQPSDEHQWEYNTDYQPLTNVSVEAGLCRILRPHQREGIIFLYRCISGIRNLKHKGAILADEMGLGKTLQCIALIWTLLKQGPYGRKPLLNRIVVVVPCSLVHNWNNEFIRWIGSHRLKTFTVDRKNRPEDYLKTKEIPVLIISYEMFVRSYDVLKDVKFDLIICDEGHRLKNSNVKAAVLLSGMPCDRRILLTGTPVQNDLQEFYALVDLANPGVLGTLKDFHKKYISAILASKQPGANEDIINEGEDKSEELNRLTSSFILRRTQSVIDKFLPVKNDYVVFCSASSIQKQIYNAIIEFWHDQYLENSDISEPYMSTHLQIIHALKKLCNHPILLKNSFTSETGSSGPFINAVESILSKQNFSSELSQDSGKLYLVRCLLLFLSKRKEKIVLVSCFTQTLDLLEDMCKELKFKYDRFDGSTTVSNRSSIVSNFNDSHSDTFILLLSSKAGGIGLNLIGASRLVLYDSDWNPATDLQAMARIWREGQRKQVFIYRLLTSGSIEEKIFQRQLSKAGLNEAIVDRTESNVKLSLEEIKKLFSPIGNDGCITHTSLSCDCDGDGKIPKLQTDGEILREAELLCENSSIKTSLRMNQLFQWEHHSKPIAEDLLNEMGLLDGDSINFIFKNKSS